MITYPEANFAQNLREEILDNAAGLPPWPEIGGTAVNYTDAPHAYALDVTLMHDPWRTLDEIRTYGPSEVADILLVERASGDGVIGSFSAVSGYIDTLHDPAGGAYNPSFDPVAYTLREELETECGFTDASFDLVQFYAGEVSTYKRTRVPNSQISVVPILGICTEKPEITVDKEEVASYVWAALKKIGHFKNLSPGYAERTLPAALTIVGMDRPALLRHLYPLRQL